MRLEDETRARARSSMSRWGIAMAVPALAALVVACGGSSGSSSDSSGGAAASAKTASSGGAASFGENATGTVHFWARSATSKVPSRWPRSSTRRTRS